MPPAWLRRDDPGRGGIRDLPRGLHAQLQDGRSVPPAVRTAAEGLIAAGLHHAELDPSWSALGGESALLLARREWIQRVEFGTVPGEFDGAVGPGAIETEPLTLSPTSLEKIARCPFQFLGTRLLGLDEVEDPEGQQVPDARALGKICHKVLEDFFRAPAAMSIPDEVVAPRVRERLAIRAGEFERREPVGPELVWLRWQEVLGELLPVVALEERQRMRAAGRRPAAFEKSCGTLIPLEQGQERLVLKAHGYLDRLDVAADGGAGLEVVDYKFTLTSKLSWRTSKKDPLGERKAVEMALAGRGLQLPLYLRMAETAGAGRPALDDRGTLVFFGPNLPGAPVTRRGLSRQVWEGDGGRRLRETLFVLARVARDGIFPIIPSERNCFYCPLTLVCRKNHAPSRARGEKLLAQTGLDQLGRETEEDEEATRAGEGAP